MATMTYPSDLSVVADLSFVDEAAPSATCCRHCGSIGKNAVTWGGVPHPLPRPAPTGRDDKVT